MFRSVIVGYDASDQGRDALTLARFLTDPDGDLVVCCIYPPDPPLIEPIPLPLSTEAEARTRLDAARDLLRDDPRAVYVARRERSAAEGLHTEAQSRGSDLIVVGSSHRGTIGRILPGSVTHQVLQAAPCSVAVAPRALHTADLGPTKTIGVAYDGSGQAQIALHVAAAMARRCGAAIHVIAVVDVVAELGGWAAAWSYGEIQEAERAGARAQVDDAISQLADIQAVGVVREGGAADELIALSSELDLLVVGSRNYGPLRRALLGTVSGRVAEHAHCPVLVVPRHAVSERAEAMSAIGAEAGQ